MTDTTTIDTGHFRELLEAERERIASALEHLHESNSTSLEDETDDIPSDNHLGDTASATLERSIDAGLEEGAEQTLAAIDAALERIEAGTYGTCERCGKPIGEERLEAIPYATLCIEDKRKQEQG
jgi:RNA polymerase-binding protein DksA